MDVRFSSERRERLLEIVAESIGRGRPLSLVRIGDGEAYVYEAPSIPGIAAGAFDGDDRVRERTWWGVALEEAERRRIAEGVRAAIAGTDCLGFPSVYRIVRDLGDPGLRFGANQAQRGLLVVLNALGGQIPTDGTAFTEERCHQILFRRDSLEALARTAKRLVVVSCWGADQLELAGRVETHSILVSPHSKVRRAAAGGRDASPLWKVHPEIEDAVASLSGPGVLVLVSAGIIGKIFAWRARQEGAVALDIGAVTDYLAGYKTRSISDMV